MNYLAANGEAQAVIEVKHSKFIAIASFVSSVDCADAFVRKIKKQYPDATHAPYAYVAGERGEYTRASDDGEPSGTSGAPICEAIKNAGLTNTAVVVVRYFGGIKLGTGGLAHAYMDAAAAALQKVQKSLYVKCKSYNITFAYQHYSAIQGKVFGLGGKVITSDFAGDASMQVAVPSESDAAFISALNDVTSGKAKCEFTGEDYFLLK